MKKFRKPRAKAKSNARPKTVAEYLARVPQPARGTLEKIRDGIPAFRHEKVLVWYAAFSDHCSLFPTAAVIAAFRKELQGYSISKGTIHFPFDKPLPAALVGKIVKMRVAEGQTKLHNP